MRDARQITVLRSLFKTLHPVLASGIKSGLAPAKRMLTSVHSKSPERSEEQSGEQSEQATGSTPSPVRAPAANTSSDTSSETPQTQKVDTRERRPELPPLPRTLTDEHLVAELENATRQYELSSTKTATPARLPARSPGRHSRPNHKKNYNRDTLLSLLEEAKVRIEVLETELELARGSEEHIPLLTEEWVTGSSQSSESSKTKQDDQLST